MRGKKKTRLFLSESEISAVLDGKQDVIRRAILPQLVNPHPGMKGLYFDMYNKTSLWEWWGADNRVYGKREHSRVCPFGAPGDLVYVPETWAFAMATAFRLSTGVVFTPDPSDPSIGAVYKDGWVRSRPGLWRSPAIMKEWAARIHLRIKYVYVQKLHHIYEHDPEEMISNGIVMHTNKDEVRAFNGVDTVTCNLSRDEDLAHEEYYRAARTAFALGWDSSNKEHKFDENPDVWVVEFERIER